MLRQVDTRYILMYICILDIAKLVRLNLYRSFMYYLLALEVDVIATLHDKIQDSVSSLPSLPSLPQLSYVRAVPKCTRVSL